MTTAKLTFACQDCESFSEEVKARVAEYFSSRGLSPKANAVMVAKTAIILGTFVGAYALILSGRFGPWGMLGLAALMGVAMAGIGFSISHDALHGAYAHRPWVNRLIGYTFDLLGANGYMWRITHNVVHHTYTNIHGIDEDLEVSPLLRLSPHAAYRPFHRVQHLYALLAYSFSTLNWGFWKDFDYFTRRKLGPYDKPRHAPVEIVTLVAGKLCFLTWSILIPLLLVDVPLWQLAIGYLTLHMVAGVILGLVFQLAHVVELTEHLSPDARGHMEHSWFVHEMHTTANFATRNRLLSWYVGGLNFQVEHHLFPKTCSVHYPAISGIVRAVAAKHGVPYLENRTFRQAVRSHLRVLRNHGRGPAAEPGLAGAAA